MCFSKGKSLEGAHMLLRRVVGCDVISCTWLTVLNTLATRHVALMNVSHHVRTSGLWGSSRLTCSWIGACSTLGKHLSNADYWLPRQQQQLEKVSKYLSTHHRLQSLAVPTLNRNAPKAPAQCRVLSSVCAGLSLEIRPLQVPSGYHRVYTNIPGGWNITETPFFLCSKALGSLIDVPELTRRTSGCLGLKFRQ